MKCSLQTAVLLVLPVALFAGSAAALSAAVEKPPAEALLAKCVAAEKQANTLQATGIVIRSIKGRNSAGIVRIELAKQNLGRFDFPAMRPQDPELAITSDGQMVEAHDNRSKVFAVLPADPDGLTLSGMVTPISGGIETALFFRPDALISLRDPQVPVKLVGTIAINGVTSKVLQVTTRDAGVARIFVGPDGLSRGGSLSDASGSIETRLGVVQYNAKLKASDFVWAPTEGYKALSLPRFMEALNGKQ